MRKPYALLVNDLHISKDNTLEYEKNWREMLEVCKTNKIDRILIGGDVFTTRNVQYLHPLQTVHKCLQTTSLANIETYIAPGNHDLVDLDAQESWCDLYRDIPNVFVCNTFRLLDMDDLYVCLMAYYPENGAMLNMLDKLDEQLAELKVPTEDVVLYVHAGVHGALGDMELPNELPQKRLKKYNKVLCGHYHNRTKIKGTEIEYIGGSRAQNFGEDEEKGYTLLYCDGTTEFVKNEVNTRYVTEEISYDEVGTWKRTYDERYQVRLCISCTSAQTDTIDKESLLTRGANKVVYITERIQATTPDQSVDMEEKFDTGDIQIEYKNFCASKDIDSALGVKYLKKI